MMVNGESAKKNFFGRTFKQQKRGNMDIIVTLTVAILAAIIALLIAIITKKKIKKIVIFALLGLIIGLPVGHFLTPTIISFF
jgi:Ca2+/Na+ antiporter